MHFKGTIIITDPCYIINNNTSDDWELCDYGDNMEALGLETYITENTLYGDWSCTTFEAENPRKLIEKLSKFVNDEEYDSCNKLLKPCTPLGEFCADAGLVSVFILDEVRKYNPNIDTWIKEHSWCVTTIPDFDGDVDTIVDSNGDLHVVGEGNINFVTFQTGL